MSQGQIMGKQAALIRELLFKMLDCQFPENIHKLVNVYDMILKCTRFAHAAGFLKSEHVFDEP